MKTFGIRLRWPGAIRSSKIMMRWVLVFMVLYVPKILTGNATRIDVATSAAIVFVGGLINVFLDTSNVQILTEQRAVVILIILLAMLALLMLLLRIQA